MQNLSNLTKKKYERKKRKKSELKERKYNLRNVKTTNVSGVALRSKLSKAPNARQDHRHAHCTHPFVHLRALLFVCLTFHMQHGFFCRCVFMFGLVVKCESKANVLSGVVSVIRIQIRMQTWNVLVQSAVNAMAHGERDSRRKG